MSTPGRNAGTQGKAALFVVLTIVLIVGCVRRYEAERVPGRAPERKTSVKAPPLEASESPDERAARGFSGPVRRVVSTSYHPAFDGSGRLEMFMYSIIVFDRTGGFVSEDFFDSSGACTSRTIAMRNTTGRLAGTESWSGAGILESKATFDYAPSGRLVRETYSSADGTPRGGIVYEHDPEGRLSKRLTRAEYQDGSVRNSLTLYRYDGGGRLIEEIYTDADRGDVDLRIEHDYRNGVLVRSSDYQRGRWLEYRTFYERDRFDNCVRETSFQIPENEYGDSFASATSPDSFPRSFLSSVTTREYEYYESP